MTSGNSSDSSDPKLPPEIQAALKREYGPPAGVPESVDRRILADAERHLSSLTKPSSARPKSKRWVGWAAGTMTAALLLMAGLPFLADRNGERDLASRSMSTPMAPGAVSNGAAMRSVRILSNDFDQNGRVNILDAFALAQQVESDTSANFDLNGDGRTDLADADSLAMNAVTL